MKVYQLQLVNGVSWTLHDGQMILIEGTSYVLHTKHGTKQIEEPKDWFPTLGQAVFAEIKMLNDAHEIKVNNLRHFLHYMEKQSDKS